MNISPREQRVQTTCLVILSIIAVAAALSYLKPVLIPFVLAIFFTFILTPLIDAQVRWLKFPRPLAIVTALLCGFVMLFL